MRLLAVIFCYERPYLLRNAVESFFAFGPDADLLIVDDGSEDKELRKYLDDVRKQPRTSVIIRKKDAGGSHGGLYVNMTLATEYAMQKDYTHIFYLQDDVQFMWKDASFLERVQNVFEQKNDASMVSCLFQKGIIGRQMRKRLIPHTDINAWHLMPYGMADIGIMPVSLLRERRWTFGESETENNTQWYEWGYRLYTLSMPTLAFVPWPPVDAGGKRYGKTRRTKEHYMLKPLTQRQIDTLRSMTPEQIPFHEDFCLPWGWRCFSPYWFTRFTWKEYLPLLWKSIRHGERWPKIVTAK